MEKTQSPMDEAISKKIGRLVKHTNFNNIKFFGTLLAEMDVMREEWAEWKAEPDRHPDVMRQMLLLEQLFESRVIETALTDKCNVSIVLFLLKSVYGLSDKPIAHNQNTDNARLELPCIQIDHKLELL